MYKLSYYSEQTKAEMIEFMRAHSFALVTGISNGSLESTHLPLDVLIENDKIIFEGHLMKKTSHHLAFEKNNQVLVVFSSPYAYINANWYENPKSGSTVNYMVVHAKGKISFLDEKGTRGTVEKITAKHIGFNTAASFDQLPEEYIEKMVKAIAGFRIEVENLDSVFKLSQDRHNGDRQTIIKKLEERALPGDLFIAAEMKKRIH